MPTYADLINRIIPHLRMAQQGGAAAAVVDEGRVEQCMLEILSDMADRMDVDSLVRFDVPLFVTSPGVRTYALPEDFGRTMTFRQPRQTGIRCNDGTTEWDLFKEQSLDFLQGKSLSNSRPARFIITADGMTLDPAPDSNGALGSYTIRGTYQQKLDYNTFDLTQEVLFEFPQALQDATQLKYMGADYAAPLIRMINGEKRQRTELQWAYQPQRWRRWRRKAR